MITYIQQRIKNKKVLILGFGREGKTTLPVLLDAGTAAQIAIADLKPVNAEFDPSVRIITGEDYLNCLNEFDIVFKSPGIVLPLEPQNYTCDIVSQMELFFEVYRDRIIGITGTKGKSTTTTLLYHILKNAGRDVLLAGNIGIPVFEVADRMGESTVAVLELSCHQLEYMDVSPHRAVYLNLHEEHLDHYKTMEKYVHAKENIYRNQKKGDVLYCLASLAPNAVPFTVKTIGNPSVCDKEDVSVFLEDDCIICRDEQGRNMWHYMIPAGQIRLLGEHNYLDIAFVYAICKDYGITDEEFTAGLKTYEPLPHRLQYIGTEGGIRWYDDSISTIDETAIQAMETLKDADTVLIGGMDRGISYLELEQYLSTAKIRNIILMEETGKRIAKEMQERFPQSALCGRLQVVEHLADAVELAKKVTAPGKSCVLSPAAASYGIFKNFEERGDVFAKLVHSTEQNIK